MLVSLNIKNIALIDECRLSLGKGLNILSGETGAGKSIIIDALSFVLGCRADKSLIRFGEKQASVEAVFETENKEIFKLLDDFGIPSENTLVIKRTMSETRNEIRVNGETFTISMLKKLTSILVDILGQHEHQSLLKTSNHIELLDKFAGKEAAELKAEVKSLYNAYVNVRDAIAELGDTAERARRIDILRYQIEELERAELKEGEEEELLILREKYRNGERIVTSVANAYNSLESSELSVTAAVAAAHNTLISVSNYDVKILELAERLESAKIELKDIADTLADYAEYFEFDERGAAYVEQRVDTIKTLKRKYGGTVTACCIALDNFKNQYDSLSNAEEKMAVLEAELNKVSEKLYKAASGLSKLRRDAAVRFEERIVAELSELAMKGAKFGVSFSEIPEKNKMYAFISDDGFDNVEFMISPNTGEPLKPLVKIASGGETSRIMLALENIVSALDGIDTLVFDEIDTGISGKVAQVVSVKLDNISRGKQVIAVTHLPQLASFADNHYLISKRVEGEKTVTELQPLKGDSRIDEIVRLSGGAGSEISRLHANELLQNALTVKGQAQKGAE